MLKSDPNTGTKVEIPATELTVVQLRRQFSTVIFSFGYFFIPTGTSDIASIQASSYFLLMVHFLFKALHFRL